MTSELGRAVLIANKDFRIFLKDRIAMGFSLAFPLMFVLAFTIALSGVGEDEGRLTLTVVTREEAGTSREIIDDLASSTDSNTVFQTMEYERASAMVEGGELSGFLAFPEDFTAAMESGAPISLELVSHADRPFTQAALAGLAGSISGRLEAGRTAARAAALLTRQHGGAPDEASDLAAEPIVTFEIEQVGELRPFKASNFTLPGYLTMFVFFAAMLGATAITRERSNQTLERLMSNGVGGRTILVGKYLGLVYVALIQLAVLWAVGLLGFGIDLGHAPAAVIGISMVLALTSAGFAVLMSTFVRTERTADAAGVLVSMMLAPIGGCWWPLFIAPEWLRSLALFTPHGWANTGFNKLMLFGAEFGDVLPEFAALGGMGVAFIALALWRFKPAV